jgi:hypothetical protein
MSRRLLLTAVLLLSAFFFSCSGEDGPVGPKGNANVVMYNYGSQTTTSGSFNYDFEATQGLVESCIVLGYYNPLDQDTTCYYAVPGLGSNGQYMTRSWWYRTTAVPSTYTYFVRLLNPNGSGTYATSTTFRKFKLILVPASSIVAVTSKGMLDLSDYNAVKNYLKLSE